MCCFTNCGRVLFFLELVFYKFYIFELMVLRWIHIWLYACKLMFFRSVLFYLTIEVFTQPLFRGQFFRLTLKYIGKILLLKPKNDIDMVMLGISLIDRRQIASSLNLWFQCPPRLLDFTTSMSNYTGLPYI